MRIHWKERTRPRRDAQRQKVYNAETVAWASVLGLKIITRDPSEKLSREECVLTLHELLDNPKVVERYGHFDAFMRFAPQRRRCSAWYHTDYIVINRFGMNVPMIIHEFTHLVSPELGHGPGFVEAYSFLVGAHYGTKYENRFKQIMKAHGCRSD